MISDDNYWERGGSVNPVWLAPKKTVVTPQDIIRMRASGQQPSEAEIRAALEYMDSQPQQIGPKIGKSDPFSPAVNDPGINKGYVDKMRDNFPDDPYLEPEVKRWSSFKPSVAPADISKVAGIGGNMLSIADKIMGMSEPKQDPESIWARLAQENSLDNYMYHGPSAESMATKEFAPQFSMLDQIVKDQKARYGTNKQDIAGMYQALVSDTRQGAGDINQVYKDATQQINANGAQAAQNVSGNFDKSQNALMGEVSRLGLEEGSSDLAAAKQKVMTEALTALSGQQQSAADMNTTLGANAFAYGTERADINQQAGVNAQTDLMNAFNTAQQENDYRRMDLTGNKQAQINKYLMDISGMNQQGQSAWNDDIQKRMDTILGYNQNQSSNLLRQAGLDLDKAKFLGQSESLNPLDSLSQRASQTLGGDAAASDSLIRDLVTIWQSNPTATPGELMASLNQDVIAQDPRLLALAFDFFNRVGVKAK